jgi:predicted metalloenzyme YecM
MIESGYILAYNFVSNRNLNIISHFLDMFILHRRIQMIFIIFPNKEEYPEQCSRRDQKLS